ncbi:SpoIID/LytB domain-containing protein [Paenibacillus humicola]|uniref:SpoIID/LytB domain-containing protein n=1 Tax=Paenibacillus humicola TaxID=3110540 RepID=UPI00237B4816|nr:SpoIID/LytB domain-containing protein [Paenibacillus humicola]
MRKMLAALLAALLLVSAGTGQPSYGAVPSLDTIRVAIFINVPGKYQLNTAATTLGSAGALQVGLRLPSGVQSLFQSAAGSVLRFTLDDYKPKLAETPDFQAAQAVAKRVAQLGGSPLLTSADKGGARLYQVLEGSYPTASAAKSAGDKYGGDPSVAKLAGAAKPVVTGPLHLEAGAYETADEARQAAQSIASAAGVDAFPAVKASAGGGEAFTVLVGDEPDADSLKAVKTAAANAVPGTALKPTDASSVYLPLRDDHTVTASADAATPLYEIPSSGAKVWVSTEDAGGIKLSERYGRSYRGQFELSGFNSKLAVINELPFEQYLYSVVGAEMPASWPAEALKAQAVAARSYALFQGFGFQVAQVVDTTISQAYNGIGSEQPATTAAVDATKGEVAVADGKPIEAVFTASAGGATADASEVWGSDVSYLKSVPSPDETSETGLHRWYRVVLDSGKNGYVRDDLLEDTGKKNDAGLELMRSTGDGVKVRPVPLVQDSVPVVDTIDKGTVVTVLEETSESNKMNWIRGPYSSDDLTKMLKGKLAAKAAGPIRSLEVGKTGPSGRPLELLANGSPLDVKYPEQFRSLLGGLPSTLFTVDETARMTIEGAGGGNTRERPGDGGPLAVIGANGQASELSDGSVYILNGSGAVRAATASPSFRIIGHGDGHGVGMSQYGALGLADSGYDYQYILKYYYKGASIVKDED